VGIIRICRRMFGSKKKHELNFVFIFTYSICDLNEMGKLTYYVYLYRVELNKDNSSSYFIEVYCCTNIVDYQSPHLYQNKCKNVSFIKLTRFDLMKFVLYGLIIPHLSHSMRFSIKA